LLVGAYLFGTVTSLGFTLQARGVNLPPELFSALPYLLTIISLVVMSKVVAGKRVGAPSGLGVPYVREEE
jgi:simple sugar transport system permease protein